MQFEFGSAVRSPGARRNVARGLPGFSFDLHAPDPNRGELVWVEMRINWFFNGWKSEWPRNDKSTSVRFEGSVDWYWFLTGHPQFFDKAPILLTDGGHFSFYTSIPPGGRGFDVGWICPARSGIFTNVPDKQDERNLSPLDRLLSLQVGNVLKLWFAMDTRRASPEARHDPWGADRIDWVYAYLVQDQPRR